MMEKPTKKSRSRTFQAKKNKESISQDPEEVMSLDCLVRGEGRGRGGSVHSTVLTGQLQEFICKTFFVSYRRV